MRIYKNPFVSRESYFVKTGKGQSYKMEASKSKGYAVDFIDGKWVVREVCYYDHSLRNEMPVISDPLHSPVVSIKRFCNTIITDSEKGTFTRMMLHIGCLYRIFQRRKRTMDKLAFVILLSSALVFVSIIANDK